MKDIIKINLNSQIESAKAFYESEVARLTEEAEQTDRIETCRKVAHDMHELYTHFLCEGFTEEQAWELIKIVVAK